MSEMDPNRTTESEEQSSYTPASFGKRVAAWMGIVYALMFCFVITFSMYRPGRSLAGTFPLFLVPVAVAAIVASIYRQTKRNTASGLVTTIFLVVLCLAVAGVGLWLGMPPLAAALVG